MKRLRKAVSLLTLCTLLSGMLFQTSVLPALNASAEDSYTEGTYDVLTYHNFGDYIMITDCDETASEAEIPAEIEGVPVTGIGEQAFSACPYLTEITIPENITIIERGVFIGTPLTAIEVDADNSAFCSIDSVLFDKEKTTLLSYPSGRNGTYSIPDGVSHIGEFAFQGCTELTAITMPDSVISIGMFAFAQCDALTSVTIPNGITQIAAAAFSDCSALTSVKLPNSITIIDKLTFSYCSALESIVIPEGVTEIGAHAFSECDSLTEISLPHSLTTLGENAFYDCPSLRTITVDEQNPYFCVKDGVLFSKDMSELIQYPRAARNSVYVIPDSVTTIKTYAFSWCSDISTIVIPKSVTFIEYGAFNACIPAVTYFTGTSEEWKKITIEECNGGLPESYDINFNYTTALGDINADTTVDATDAALLLQALAAKGAGEENILTDEQQTYADYNSDGTSDATDAALILQDAAHNGVANGSTIKLPIETIIKDYFENLEKTKQ